jgi:hypothetical protein
VRPIVPAERLFVSETPVVRGGAAENGRDEASRIRDGRGRRSPALPSPQQVRKPPLDPLGVSPRALHRGELDPPANVLRKDQGRVLRLELESDGGRGQPEALHRFAGMHIVVDVLRRLSRCLPSPSHGLEGQPLTSLPEHRATSLARMMREQRRTREANDLLTPIYKCFTEGFDTVDLVAAKSLLSGQGKG